MHWVGRDELAWLDAQHERGSEIIGVELTDESIRLAVEIPMLGTGTSLNVAVAGSLVLYKIAGLV